ncbi:putative Ig domain-containing protein [Rhodococcus sp. 24CO]|uniref:RCC1 domain-containing protein n=1 Tax=Rhodococcus sp. 24CO TaxID=3117460 RepID=UPI003D33DC39
MVTNRGRTALPAEHARKGTPRWHRSITVADHTEADGCEGSPLSLPLGHLPSGAGAAATTAAAAPAPEGVPVAPPNTITAWGNNENGRANPPADSDFTAISGGLSHSLALTADGTIKAWGNNVSGQADAPAGNGYTAISAGSYHSLALTADGTIKIWGATGSGLDALPAGSGFKAISAGHLHSMALTADGTIKIWGSNQYGELNAPTGSGYKAIAAGFNHSVALTADGTIKAWGLNSNGQTDVPEDNGYTAIAAGFYHSFALTSDGTIKTWGDGGYGLTNPPSGNGYTAIAAGNIHSVALAADGTIKAWGLDNFGQATAPVGNGYTAVASGLFHSMTLKRATASAFSDAGTVTVNGIAGTALTHLFATTGNPAPTLTATGLPTGLTLSETGALTGTPTTEGSFPFTITATNGIGNAATLNVTLIVAAAPAAPMFTDAGPVTLDAVAGTALTREFTVTGNPAPTITVVDPTKLPIGLTFADGTLSGTPTTAGSYTFILNATNGVNPDLTLVVTVNVAEAPITPEQPTTGSLGSLEFTGFGS